MTLDTLSPEDIAAALEPVTAGEELEELDALILQEVKERLKDEDRRRDIPGTVLMQLARDVVKAQEAKAARFVEQAEDPPGLGEIIASAGLPASRKRELVRAEVLRVTDELARLNAMLDDLEAQ